MGDAALRIRLLGGLEVEGTPPAALGSRKGRTLLKRLALAAGAPVTTDVLVDTLWADGDAPARPADQVSVLVSRLRRTLGSECIAYTDGAYTLAVAWLDLDALRERVDEAARRLADGAAAAARAAATAALALVRGPLLPEEVGEDWTEPARASVTRLVARARHIAADAALRSGLAWEAAEHAAAALTADPYDEDALRMLMRAHVATGRPALALTAYAETARLVADELGVDLALATQELHVAVLRGEGAAASPQAPPRSSPALAGREFELTALDNAFERTRAGSCVVVVLEGEAGIGKTRVLGAFADRLAGRADVLRTSADTTGVLPLEPILDALARRLAGAPEEERAAILGADRDLLAPLLRPGGDGAPVEATAYRDLLMSYEPGERGAPAVLHVALLTVMARLCEQGPVALLLDDAHLADASTIAWLGLVARRGAGLPLLVVASRRTGVGTAPVPAETIAVGRLDRAAAATVVAQITGEAVDEARVDELFARSAGQPLFLVELAHASGDALPDSVRQAVVDRIADAGDAATTLRAAAVLGPEVDVDLLATVLERPASDLLDELEEGSRRHLLIDASNGYVFRHEILREALEADTASARRAWLHREAAHVLAGRGRVDQLLVAHHARLGGDVALAAHALAAAAELAGARFDHEEALRLAEASLDLAEGPDAHLIRARSLVFLRRYDEARVAATRAGVLGAGAPALEAAAYAAYYARDLDAVLRLADEAAETTDDRDAIETAQFLAAKVLHTTGTISAVQDRLMPIVRATGPSRIRPFASVWLTLAHLHAGHIEEAEREMGEADRAMTAPVPFAPIYVEQFQAHLAVLAGRPVEAITWAERMRAEVTDQHAVRFIGRAEVYRGWALSLLCAPDAGEALDEARDAARAAANPEPLGQGSLDLARLRLDGGHLDAAAALLAEVESLTAEEQVSNGWRIDLRRRYLEGRLACAGGDGEGAVGAANEVRERAGVDDLERYSVLGELLDAEARLRAGGKRAAGIDVERIAALVDRLDTVSRPDAWQITARLATLLGSSQLMARCYEQAERFIANSGPYADHIRAAVAEATAD